MQLMLRRWGRWWRKRATVKMKDASKSALWLESEDKHENSVHDIRDSEYGKYVRLT